MSDNFTIGKPADDYELDWAADGERWFNERDYPEDYTGSSTEQYLIATHLNGLKFVIKIEGPGDCGAELAELADSMLKAREAPHGK